MAKQAAAEKAPREPTHKYGVAQIAEILDVNAFTVRNKLRTANIAKDGSTYGWNNRKEFDEVVKKLKEVPTKKSKPAEAKKSKPAKPEPKAAAKKPVKKTATKAVAAKKPVKKAAKAAASKPKPRKQLKTAPEPAAEALKSSEEPKADAPAAQPDQTATA